LSNNKYLVETHARTHAHTLTYTHTECPKTEICYWTLNIKYTLTIAFIRNNEGVRAT